MDREEAETKRMSKEEMIDTLKGLVFGTFDRTTGKEREALDMAIEALSTPCMTEADFDSYKLGYEHGKAVATKWIPVKWHEITDEEREREGYPKDWVVYLDCEMPEDEQAILVTTRHGYIEKDVCYEDGEYSLDSGWDWVEDIVAWKSLPEPYKPESEE